MVGTQRGIGRSVAEAVSGRLLIAEARVRFQGTPVVFVGGGGSGTGSGFSASTSLSPPNCHSTNDPFYLISYKD
jgi:hypothetical protein